MKYFVKTLFVTISSGALFVVLTQLILYIFDDFKLNVPYKMLAIQEQFQASVASGQPWKPVEYFQVIKRNAKGVRIANQPEQSTSKNGKVVAVIGDSFVEAKQVAYHSSFCMLAEKQLPNIRVIPLYVGNLVIQDRLSEFQKRKGSLPELQDKQKIDGIIIEIRSAFLSKNAQSNDWRYLLVAKILKTIKIQELAKSLMPSRFSALSLIGYKLSVWLDLDLLSQRLIQSVEISPEQLADDAVNKIHDSLSDEFSKVGILLLPTKEEAKFRFATGLPPTKLGESLNRASTKYGISFVDAGDYNLTDRSYFRIDGHPNEDGHQKISLALKTLINNMGIDE